MFRRSTCFTIAFATVTTAAAALTAGCKTAPSDEADRQSVVQRSESTVDWFTSRVTGLRRQIDDAAAYIVFPDVGEAGFIIGGTSGFGAVFDSNGQQIGWARLNAGSIGLQAGARGFRMLMVLEDQETLERFRNNRWSGNAGAVAVAGDSGGSAAAFSNGVAVYQGASSGLMAALNLGLGNIRYQPLSAE